MRTKRMGFRSSAVHGFRRFGDIFSPMGGYESNSAIWEEIPVLVSPLEPEGIIRVRDGVDSRTGRISFFLSRMRTNFIREIVCARKLQKETK